MTVSRPLIPMRHFVDIWVRWQFLLYVIVVSSRFRQGKPIATLRLIDIGDEDQIDSNKLKSRLKPFVESKYDYLPASCSV